MGVREVQAHFIIRVDMPRVDREDEERERERERGGGE